jgi:magnesium-transporting ATPase (P-type)
MQQTVFSVCSFAQEKSSILTLEHFLLRGSKLKNTKHVLALVVYTGEETKIRMNSLARRSATAKRSAVEKTMNRMIAGMFVFQIAICAVAGYLAGQWESEHAVGYELCFVRVLAFCVVVYVLHVYVSMSPHLYCSPSVARTGAHSLLGVR